MHPGALNGFVGLYSCFFWNLKSYSVNRHFGFFHISIVCLGDEVPSCFLIKRDLTCGQGSFRCDIIEVSCGFVGTRKGIGGR